jgi:4a-hydroxytetrahydrobiopterin dehydratase
VQNSRGQSPDAASLVVENEAPDAESPVLDAILAQPLVDDRLERNEKDAGGFVGIDRELAGFDERDKRRNVEVIGQALTERRQLRNDGHARRLDADLFVQLAQCRRAQVGIFGMDAAARKTDLPGVIAQVRGALDEEHAVRRAAKDTDDYGGAPAKRRHVSELAQKSCVPCRGGAPPLTRDQAAPLLAQVDPEWKLLSREDPKRGTITLLERTYRFGDFGEAMRAAVRIGEIAEEQQHHPDLGIAWGRLRVEIWTHKIGGLTESDFVFAAKCDEALRSR